MKLLLPLILLFLTSCAVQKSYPRYKVLKVEKIKGKNAYKVTTDSFEVVKIVRGGLGKYKPDSVSKKGYVTLNK